MAESLDLQCIAEGIETCEQLELVTALGCELVQGYLFSRPVPPADFTELLRDDTASVCKEIATQPGLARLRALRS
jgi:EAL domain-containing protein (putative c-di-GMP-specific phosphodiesterase class I)